MPGLLNNWIYENCINKPINNQIIPKNTDAMKSKTFFSGATVVVLTVLLFVADNLVGQVTKKVSYAPTEVLSSIDKVQVVSARIASMYRVDKQMVESYVQAAVNHESHTGIAAPLVIAIAIHESGFSSTLFENSGNLFGIKASKPWTGPTWSKYHDGEETKFRVYGSADEAVRDFGDFVRSRVWYTDALNCPQGDYRCVIEGLKKTDLEPGYSMNPNWGEAVFAIIEKTGLQDLVSR